LSTLWFGPATNPSRDIEILNLSFDNSISVRVDFRS
jgi:hypothetical protein